MVPTTRIAARHRHNVIMTAAGVVAAAPGPAAVTLVRLDVGDGLEDLLAQRGCAAERNASGRSFEAAIPAFSLDVILQKLSDGMSLGQIIKEAKENMGEVRKGFGQFRSELARALTNPPTRDCFNAGS